MRYQKLFDYMSKEHGVTLIETDMQDICNIVSDMQNETLHQPIVSGSICDECEDGSGWYGDEDITMNCSKCNQEAK